jgi:hypothetical protein
MHLSRPALGPIQPRNTMGTASISMVKRPGSGVDHPPPLAPGLKKEYRYTSTSLPDLRGLFYGELYLYFIFLVSVR